MPNGDQEFIVVVAAFATATASQLTIQLATNLHLNAATHHLADIFDHLVDLANEREKEVKVS